VSKRSAQRARGKRKAARRLGPGFVGILSFIKTPEGSVMWDPRELSSEAAIRLLHSVPATYYDPSEATDGA